MFSKIGATELILILAVALVIFGPSRLPALGKMVGKAVGSAKKYMSGITEEITDLEKEIKAPIEADKPKKSAVEAVSDEAPEAAAEPETTEESAQEV